MFLTAGLLLFQSILSMNIAGDTEPINISSHEHRNTWSMAIPGDVSSCYEQDIQKNQNNNVNIIINNHLYSMKSNDDNVQNNISAAEFFHDLPITTSIAASMLDVMDLKLGVRCCKGFFLDSISKLSANKYVNYVELLRKFSQITKQDTKSLLEFFDAYYLVENQKIDFFDLFTHMKVDYYTTMKILKYQTLSLDEFAYLSKLDKKYTVNLDGKEMYVERTTQEVFDFMITHCKKELTDQAIIYHTTIGLIALVSDFFLKKQIPEILFIAELQSIIQTLIFIRTDMIANRYDFQIPLIKTFQSNLH